MIMAHGVARQVSGIAERHEMLLLDIVFALRLVADDVRHHKVIMIKRLRQGILRVAQQTLATADKYSDHVNITINIFIGTYAMLLVNNNRGAAGGLVLVAWLMF